MHRLRNLLTAAAIVTLAGCGQQPIRLVSEDPSDKPAILEGVNTFYLFVSRHCEVAKIDGEYLDKLGIKFLGNRSLQVEQRAHDFSIYCAHVIHPVATAYYGNLSFSPQVGHEYTIDLRMSRKCIVVIDNDSEEEIDSDCHLTSGPLRSGAMPRLQF